MAQDRHIPDASVVLLAGGSGHRFGGSIPKQFLTAMRDEDHECSVLELPIRAYSEHDRIESIIVVCHADFLSHARAICQDYPKVTQFFSGGASRQESSCIGVKAVTTPYVFIQDAARPLVRTGAIEECFALLDAGEWNINTVLPQTSSMVVLNGDGRMIGSSRREGLAAGQCPQVFVTDMIRGAQAEAVRKGTAFHDECTMLLEYCPGSSAATIMGAPSGLKITVPEDLEVVQFYLENRRA